MKGVKRRHFACNPTVCAIVTIRDSYPKKIKRKPRNIALKSQALIGNL